MASLRVSGTRELPVHVEAALGEALRRAATVPTRHLRETGHGCARTQIESSTPPDSELRTGLEQLEQLHVAGRAVLLIGTAKAHRLLAALADEGERATR